MSSVTRSDLDAWIATMMKGLNIEDFELDVAGNTIKGDGYLGEVTFVTVKTPKKTYELVVKSAKKGEELRKQTPVKQAYDREIFFYSKLLPILSEFQKQKGPEISNKFAKCYSVSTEAPKEALILENLKLKGFCLHDRKKPMNLEHVKTVFSNYGSFHAVSIALRQQKPALFKTITKHMTDILAIFIHQGKMLDTFYKIFDYVRTLLQNNGHAEVARKFDGFEKEFEGILCNLSNENCSPSVITHGDCWNNNFMFKYSELDNTQLEDMCFLDFQLSRVASPIVDLSYFLYSCADKTVLKDFDLILRVYYSSLSKSLKQLGIDPDTVVTFKKLREQWQRYGRFGLVMALFILKIELCDSDEAPDLSESAEKGEGLMEALSVDIKDQDVYDQRITDLYVHFAHEFL